MFEQYAELVEEGCRDRSRARAVDDSEDERTSSDRYPGDEVLECDRLERHIELCEPDSGRCNHRYSTMILVEDDVGSRPRPNGTSTLQHLQSASDEAKRRQHQLVCHSISHSCDKPGHRYTELY